VNLKTNLKIALVRGFPTVVDTNHVLEIIPLFFKTVTLPLFPSTKGLWSGVVRHSSATGSWTWLGPKELRLTDSMVRLA
jgi:hypothetical protein